jgi:hypothetical protein
MKAIARLYKYLDYRGIRPTKLEKEVGLSNGYLGTQSKRNADLGESIMNKIIDYCLDLNAEWLLTGRGDMLKSDAVVEDVIDDTNIELLLKILKEKDSEIKALNREIGELQAKNGEKTEYKGRNYPLPVIPPSSQIVAEPKEEYR